MKRENIPAGNRTSISKRWTNYRKANSDKPEARENELSRIFSLIDAHPGQKILEAGTGNGYLTFPLAEAVGKTGLIVTTDVNKGNVSDVAAKNRKRKLKISPLFLSQKKPFLEGKKYAGYFDTVATIATLHHFDNRLDGTGDSGRKKAIRNFYRNLRKGGKLVMADVLDGTMSQKYFDAIDDPKYCYPLGHPHDFFSKGELRRAVTDAGFKDIKIATAYVPWKFRTVSDAEEFVHTIHNAECGIKESFRIAEKYLGFKKKSGHWELGWELFFLTARK